MAAAVTANFPLDVDIVSVRGDGSLGTPISRRLAHEDPGILHLAVSVQLVDDSGLWLLQRRTASKRLFANRWSNSCCTHPGPGESPEAAAIRSVEQELGLVVGQLQPAGVFTYRAIDERTGLVEHEHDHVFVGVAHVTAAVAHPEHVGDLAAMSFVEALRATESAGGAPWASEVLRKSYETLNGD